MSCPLCNGTTQSLGCVDLNRACTGNRPALGEDVEYARCTGCGLITAPQMCRWPKDEFKRRIYNDDYVEVDPDGMGARAERNALSLHELFGDQTITHLDYGGGDGALSARLRELGWDSSSYDPFYDRAFPQRRFDLVTAFEVFEHAPDPIMLWQQLKAVSKDVVVFSTLLADHVPDPLQWWYLAPRNGHVVFYTTRALERLLGRGGFRLISIDDAVHVGFRGVPPWLEAAVT